MNNKNNYISIWLKHIRANFLILSVVLVLLGSSMAYLTGINKPIWYTILLAVGVVLAHISVNLFNEYTDSKAGTDDHTQRTPFSGGSGTLQNGELKQKTTLIVALITLLGAGTIGIFFCIVSSWWILLIMLVGGFSCIFYTNFLSHYMLGEIFAGLALGSLVIIGSHYVLTDSLPMWVIILSIPSGILTSLLLLLNEFPDVEADKIGGRNHIVIKLGKKVSSYFYIAGLIFVYLIIIVSIILFDNINYWGLLGLATLPFALIASKNVKKHYNNLKKFIPIMGLNVIIVLATNLFLAIGIYLNTIC